MRCKHAILFCGASRDGSLFRGIQILSFSREPASANGFRSVAADYLIGGTEDFLSNLFHAAAFRFSTAKDPAGAWLGGPVV